MTEIFIVNKKKNKNNFFKIEEVINVKIDNTDLLIIKNTFNEKEFMEKYHLPMIPNDEVFFFININNINFMENEIIKFTNMNEFFCKNIEIKKCEEKFETSYYLYFKKIINYFRRSLLTQSDWIFTNISDKTKILSNDELLKLKNLRNDLRNYFDNKDIKRDLIYQTSGWQMSIEFMDKYSILLET